MANSTNTSWASALEKLKNAKAELEAMYSQAAPYSVYIGNDNTPLDEVIQTMDNYIEDMSLEIRFVNENIEAPSRPAPEPATTTAAKGGLFN